MKRIQLQLPSPNNRLIHMCIALLPMACFYEPCGSMNPAGRFCVSLRPHAWAPQGCCCMKAPLVLGRRPAAGRAPHPARSASFFGESEKGEELAAAATAAAVVPLAAAAAVIIAKQKQNDQEQDPGAAAVAAATAEQIADAHTR